MTVYVLMIIQENPLRSETIHSIYKTLDAAEDMARELEFQLPAAFDLAVEPFEVSDEEEYE